MGLNFCFRKHYWFATALLTVVMPGVCLYIFFFFSFVFVVIWNNDFKVETVFLLVYRGGLQLLSSFKILFFVRGITAHC